MGFDVRRERRNGEQVTVISGEVDGPDTVDEIVRMVRLVSQGEQMTIDISRLSGLAEHERVQFMAEVADTGL